MSDILHADTFHGTKKGMRRKTAIGAYQGDKRVKSAIKLLMDNIVRLRKRKMVSQSDYAGIVNALGNYAEYYQR